MSTFPYEIVDDEENEEIKKMFLGVRSGQVNVGPSKYTYPTKYRQYAERLYNFKVRPDDVWVDTFPRSGTTVTQELTWIIANDLDFEGAKVPLTTRFPQIEASIMMDDEVTTKLQATATPEDSALLALYKDGLVDFIENSSSPRFHKTHLPLSLLPPNVLEVSKVIYVARNPLDSALSLFHHFNSLSLYNYIGTIDDFWTQFEKGNYMYGPYFPHVKEAWEKRNHPNLLFLFYEEIRKDLSGVIRKVAKFLNKTLTDEQVQKVADHLSFETFKKNDAVNFLEGYTTGVVFNKDSPFVRKGKIGSWKDELSPETQVRAKKWLDEELKKLESIGFKYPE